MAITKEQCIEEIQRIHSLHGKVTKSILQKHGNISYDVIRRRFGTIANALEKAEVPASQGQVRFKTKEDIIPDLIRVHNQYGYMSKPLYEREGGHNQKVVRRLYGSFGAMCKELNFNTSPSGYIPTFDELITELKHLFNEHGLVTAQIIREHGKYSVTTYATRFETLNEAYDWAGLPNRNPGECSHANWVIKRFGKTLNEEPIFEHRFDWLRNPKTNRTLPVDGYFPNSNIIVEYNGPQHYKLDKMYMKTEKELEYRKWLDSLKYDLIRQHGYKLIVVDYRHSFTESYIEHSIRA